ncbi:MAG: polysaccharide export protein [Candidatus Omnitrophica bacterium]|nr:polysaccharide export protein [Candidatus Omnitrophota bacterium]
MNVFKKTRGLLIAVVTVCFVSFFTNADVYAQETNPPTGGLYQVGINDVLEVSVIQPDKMHNQVIVSPDGNISFPFIGSVNVKGLTLQQIKSVIEEKLADGYMKYPVVSVFLKESRSRNFFVYGEVVKPGEYPIQENTTVLKAISLAGGFTKFGSSSNVKILRPSETEAKYETIKVKINNVMQGEANYDITIMPGDVIVVSEGIF